MGHFTAGRERKIRTEKERDGNKKEKAGRGRKKVEGENEGTMEEKGVGKYDRSFSNPESAPETAEAHQTTRAVTQLVTA